MKAMIQALALVALACGAALSQDPPFNDDAELLGSSQYIPADWDFTGSGGSSVAKMMEAGLQIVPGGPPNFASLQFKQLFTPTAGKTAWARFRVRYDHPEHIETKIGFYSDDNSPFASEPDVSAYFLSVPATVPLKGELKIVTKRSGGPVSITPLGNFLISEAESLDLVVEVSGTNRVTFYYKRMGGNWLSRDADSFDLPDGPMRYSAAVMNQHSLGNIILRLFESKRDR